MLIGPEILRKTYLSNTFNDDSSDVVVQTLAFVYRRRTLLLQLAIQFKVAPAGKNDSALDLQANIVLGVNTGSTINEIICDFKLLTKHCLMRRHIVLPPPCSLPIHLLP